jgi:tellurium resistance protein TerD
MILNLEKGANFSLNKIAPTATKFTIGLGWDIKESSSEFEHDLDAFAIITDSNSKPVDCVYFGGKTSKVQGFLELDKDNLTGEGEGCDENIFLDATKYPDFCKEVFIGCNIYDNIKRKQNFGQVSNAFIQISAEINGKDEIVAQYDLTEDASTNTYFMLGRLYKHNGEVKFQAIEKGGKADDLNQIINKCPNF